MDSARRQPVLHSLPKRFHQRNVYNKKVSPTFPPSKQLPLPPPPLLILLSSVTRSSSPFLYLVSLTPSNSQPHTRSREHICRTSLLHFYAFFLLPLFLLLLLLLLLSSSWVFLDFLPPSSSLFLLLLLLLLQRRESAPCALPGEE